MATRVWVRERNERQCSNYGRRHGKQNADLQLRSRSRLWVAIALSNYVTQRQLNYKNQPATNFSPRLNSTAGVKMTY